MYGRYDISTNYEVYDNYGTYVRVDIVESIKIIIKDLLNTSNYLPLRLDNI